jgi:putative ABC transport system permease protein
MQRLWQDLRYATRLLAGSPGFAAIAILTLALGIGATTAIFSVVYGVLIRPLTLPESQQIAEVVLRNHGEISEDAFTYQQFRFVQEHSRWPAAIAAFTHVGFNLSAGTETQRVSGLHVSSAYFAVLGVNPLVGRTFTAEEDHDPSARVAILSETLWKQQLGSDPRILGQTIRLNGRPYQVVGVLPGGLSDVQLGLVPPAFGDLQHVDLWTTLAPVVDSIGSGENLQVVARIKPNLTMAQASAELASLTEPFRKDALEPAARNQTLSLSSVQQVMASGVDVYLWILLATVGFVLLIACANISNLLLARGMLRSKEVAVRAALGASQSALVGQSITESLAPAAAGGGTGILAAQMGTGLLLRFVPEQLPRATEIHLDGWALLFALAVTIGAGMASGIVPALRVPRADVHLMLKENAAQSLGGVRRSRFRNALVVAEIALWLVLLVGASLLAETFVNLLRVDPGFDAQRVLSAEIWLTGSRIHSTIDLTNFYDNLTTKIRQLPGVEDVAVVSSGQPLERGGNANMAVDGVALGSRDFRVVTPEYFHTLRVAILQGRDFSAADTEQAEPVVVVNQSFVRKLLKKRDPLSSTVRVGDGGPVYRIVGVAADVKSFVGFPPDPTAFLPAAQTKFGLLMGYDVWFPTHVLVRSAGRQEVFGKLVSEAIRETDSSIAVGHVLPMEAILARSLATQRFMMLLVGIFALLALVLASVGIYGLLAFSVSQRTHEIGIRGALGANRGDILRMVIGEGAKLALIGAAIGIAVTFALQSALASVLFGVEPNDWRTILGACLCLLLVACAACYFPARRATKWIRWWRCVTNEAANEGLSRMVAVPAVCCEPQ